VLWGRRSQESTKSVFGKSRVTRAALPFNRRCPLCDEEEAEGVAAAAGDGNAAVRGEVVSECGLWGGNARLPSTRHLIHETKLTCLEPTVTSTCGASSAPAWKWRFNRELSIRKRDFNTVLKM
jgi:hypothetical protein